MTPLTMEILLSWVAPLIVKKETQMKEPIRASERLCVTMRYLLTGDAQVTISASYRMSPTVVGRIIYKTSLAIWEALHAQGYLDALKSKADWKRIAHKFVTKWDFPNALGAIDEKHVLMQATARSGSAFFNYNKQFSIVLMAVCSANYKFLFVDIGDSGRQSDGSVYSNSNLEFAIEENKLHIPEQSKLLNSERILPYVFVADNAFGLKNHMMKPYLFHNLSMEIKIFNYRLLRARRVVENAFGIATSCFRVFRRPIIAKVNKVVVITKAVVALTE